MRKSPVKLKCGSGQKCGSFRGGGEGGGRGDKRLRERRGESEDRKKNCFDGE